MTPKTSKSDTQEPKPRMPGIINTVCILNIKICEHRTDKSKSSREPCKVCYVVFNKAVLAHLYVCGSVFVPYSE